MKRPLERGAEISLLRIESWIDTFGSYRHQVTEGRVERWLRQFQERDVDLAARLLDAVDFVGHMQMSQLFQQMLGAIPGWHRNPARRAGRWRFVPYAASSGESGDAMVHSFRLANNLDGNVHNDLFVRPRDLLSERLTARDTVILIDDFSGTGQQICDVWERSFQELLPAEPRTFVMLLGASTEARRRIVAETRLRPVLGFQLTERDKIFSDACPHFSREEKERLLNYCRRASRQNPAGFGHSGFVVVFAHRCPNNSVPVLHRTHGDWAALFPRHD